LSEQAYFYGTGKRKTAVAQVRIMPGNGAVIVNGKPFEDFFTISRWQSEVLEPLKISNTLGKLNTVVKVTGGGPSSQAGAVRHGISRALVRMDESFRPLMRYRK